MTSGRDPRSPGQEIVNISTNIPYQFAAFNLGDYNKMIEEIDRTILSFKEYLVCTENCITLDKNHIVALYYSARQYIPGHLNQKDYVNIKIPTQVINRGHYILRNNTTGREASAEYRSFHDANEVLRKLRLLEFYEDYSWKLRYHANNTFSNVYEDSHLEEIIDILKNDHRLDQFKLNLEDDFGNEITLRNYLSKIEINDTDANTDTLFYAIIGELKDTLNADYVGFEDKLANDIKWSTLNKSSYMSSDIFFEWVIWNFELESFRTCSRNRNSFLCIPNSHERKYIEQTLFPIIYNGKLKFVDTDYYGTGKNFFNWKEMSVVRTEASE